MTEVDWVSEIKKFIGQNRELLIYLAYGAAAGLLIILFVEVCICCQKIRQKNREVEAENEAVELGELDDSGSVTQRPLLEADSDSSSDETFMLETDL